MKNRLINADLIKAVSILAVVFLHSPEIFTEYNPFKFHLLPFRYFDYLFIMDIRRIA
jgi:fucose 4-O-acetylase-like acetyltransferase